MPLTLKQIQDVCLAYAGDHTRCRYLAQDENDARWYCLKKSTRRQDIDDETNEFLKDAKKKGLDPRKQGAPLGDNCPGYPILKNLDQGYDKD